jgi:hypothetical protein
MYIRLPLTPATATTIAIALTLLIGLACPVALSAASTAEAEVRTLSASIIDDVRSGRIQQALDRVEGALRGGRIAAAEARDILQLAVATNTLVASVDGGSAVAAASPNRPEELDASSSTAVARAQALLDGDDAGDSGGSSAATAPAQGAPPATPSAEVTREFIGKIQATQENEAGDTAMVLMDIGQEDGVRIGDRVQVYQNGKPLVEVMIKTAEESDSLGLVLPKTLVEGGVPLVLIGDIVKPVAD